MCRAETTAHVAFGCDMCMTKTYIYSVDQVFVNTYIVTRIKHIKAHGEGTGAFVTKGLCPAHNFI